MKRSLAVTVALLAGCTICQPAVEQLHGYASGKRFATQITACETGPQADRASACHTLCRQAFGLSRHTPISGCRVSKTDATGGVFLSVRYQTEACSGGSSEVGTVDDGGGDIIVIDGSGDGSTDDGSSDEGWDDGSSDGGWDDGSSDGGWDDGSSDDGSTDDGSSDDGWGDDGGGDGGDDGGDDGSERRAPHSSPRPSTGTQVQAR